ncbi:uncharacterized protein LOC106060878 isoform X1 [Biomphalaria glabrata]|uniref:Uncharacterized protein LOC106060878 isoform X1 n=2 Tax=Biomphalaria glabrata TaxID=6526 RepID=A0A9W2Z0Q5_BIOGL|nr:uncharacterized protein LOC106060878 isoform X1 [Biomphalaria glabrata]
MAAPIVSKDKIHTTLQKLRQKENSAKVVRKNVLCLDKKDWPRPPQCFMEKVIAVLSEKLKSLPNIFKRAEPNSEDSEAKSKVRCQLSIGVSQLLRDLDKDNLACVLVSNQASPSITVNHLILVCQEKCCPVLCVNDLAVSVAKSTDSKCFPLAIGFKRVAAGDFSEIISMVQKSEFGQSLKAETQTDEQIKLMEQKKPVYPKPIHLNEKEEETLLAELRRVFTVMVAAPAVKQEVKKKKKKKPKKKNLKLSIHKDYHSLFDFGKRTVCELVLRGNMQLVLVSKEIIPVLLAEPQVSSLLSAAAKKNCPVLEIAGLTSTLRPLCQGCVSVLGIRKFSTNSTQEHFHSLVGMCLSAIANQHTATQHIEGAALAEDLNNKPKSVSERKPRVSSESSENEDLDEAEVDYSHLYILKSESLEYSQAMSKLKTDLEKHKQEQNFKSDFISFGESNINLASTPRSNPDSISVAKPKYVSASIKTPKMLVSNQALHPTPGVHAVLGKDEGSDLGETSEHSSSTSQEIIDSKVVSSTDATTDTLCFTLSRSGDANLLRTNKKAEVPKPAILTSVQHQDTETLGTKQLVSTSSPVTTGIDYIVLADPAAQKSKRKALKRKLKTQGEYLPFVYKEANIKTMTGNPNKKKKKKKK